jgi:hypothetical protein
MLKSFKINRMPEDKKINKEERKCTKRSKDSDESIFKIAKTIKKSIYSIFVYH